MFFLFNLFRILFTLLFIRWWSSRSFSLKIFVTSPATKQKVLMRLYLMIEIIRKYFIILMVDVILYSKSFIPFFSLSFWPHNFPWLQITVLQRDIINLRERTRSFHFGVFHGHFWQVINHPSSDTSFLSFRETPVARFWCTGL